MAKEKMVTFLILFTGIVPVSLGGIHPMERPHFSRRCAVNVNILNRMMVAGVISAVSLVGMSLPTNAQQQQQQDQKQQKKQKKEQPPAQQQQQQNQSKQQQQRVQQQQQQNQSKQQQQRVQQQVNRSSQQGQRVQQAEQRGVWQQHRASSWQADHRTWQQRGGYNGYRIPQDHFSGYFGSGHGFRIYSLPLIIVGGYPRFQYGGYWFSLIDPWPEDWSADWYQSDDVYIDYSNDGYYLYNRRHPGVGLAISVFVN
jgi:flagellar motor protein MotB